MLTVYKYPVPIKDHFCIRMPKHAQILSFQSQRDQPQIWALVDPESEHTDRKFRIAGTGHSIEEPESDLIFVGTCQMDGGSLVWHLFEYIPF